MTAPRSPSGTVVSRPFERRDEPRPIIVKVTSHAHNAKARARRIAYLAHHVSEVETHTGHRVPVKDAATQSHQWRQPHLTYRPDGKYKARYSAQIFVSFPQDTDPRVVPHMARQFAMETFAGHEYCWAVASAHGYPRLYFVVATPGDAGALQTNRADLFHWWEELTQRYQEWTK